MIKKYLKILIPLCFTTLLLSGCWDELNIEERGFVFGSAIDVEDGENPDNSIISFTNQFIVPSGIGSPESGGGEASDAYRNVTVKGGSMAMMDKNMATMASRFPFYGHLKVLIFSEDLAKEADLMPNLFDFFIRDPHMRREIKVFIAEGEAKDMLDVEPTPEKIPAQFINQFSEHNDKIIESMKPLKIGIMQSYLLNDMSYIIPKLMVTEGHAHAKGGAVFRGPDNKLVGSLNERETKGYMLATQNNKEGSIQTKVDGNQVVFDISETKSNITINVDDPKQVDVSIHVEAKGYLEEMFGGESIQDEQHLNKISSNTADKMKELINETIQKSQKDLHVDILHVGQTIQKKHYKVWKKIQDNWEEGENYFDNTAFQVNVNATVIDAGAIDRARENGRDKD